MIKPNEIYQAIKIAEALALLASERPTHLDLRPIAEAHPEWLTEPPPPRSGPLWDFLTSLDTEAVRDLYALMYAGRGDGSFIACHRDAMGRGGDHMRFSIFGKAPSVLAEYWRAAVKRHPAGA